MPFVSREDQEEWEANNGVFWEECYGDQEICNPGECFKHFPESIPH